MLRISILSIFVCVAYAQEKAIPIQYTNGFILHAIECACVQCLISINSDLDNITKRMDTIIGQHKLSFSHSIKQLDLAQTIKEKVTYLNYILEEHQFIELKKQPKFKVRKKTLEEDGALLKKKKSRSSFKRIIKAIIFDKI